MTTRERATGALAAASAAALVVALAAPLPTAVVGIIVLGVLAVLLEVRYLVGRFPALVRRDVVRPLVILLGAITVLRLVQDVAGPVAIRGEVVLGCAVLGLAAHVGLRRRRRDIVWGVLVVVGVASLLRPDLYAFGLLHLHQVVVVVFLWDWANRLTGERSRRGFRVACLTAFLVVPALVLAGVADRWLTASPGFVRSVVGDGDTFVAAVTGPGASTVLALRLLAAFAYLHTMQLLVWVAFLPRYAPEESAAFEARFPWVTGPRLWAVGFIAAAVLAVVLGISFAQGQTLYAALAAWAVYLELPAALVLLIGAGRARHRSRWQPARHELGADDTDLETDLDPDLDPGDAFGDDVDGSRPSDPLSADIDETDPGDPVSGARAAASREHRGTRPTASRHALSGPTTRPDTSLGG